MFGPVQTKLDELTISRFYSCLIGTGKTTQMKWAVDKILEAGETCLIITPNTFTVKFLFPNNELPKGVKTLHIDKLLKYLKRYPNDGNPQTEQDPYTIYHRAVELFDCDRIVVDPECYIKIIQQFMEKLSTIKQQLNKIQI